MGQFYFTRPHVIIVLPITLLYVPDTNVQFARVVIW